MGRAGVEPTTNGLKVQFFPSRRKSIFSKINHLALWCDTGYTLFGILSAYAGAYADCHVGTGVGRKHPMPTLDKRLTDSIARAIPLPASGEVLHWCPEPPASAFGSVTPV